MLFPIIFLAFFLCSAWMIKLLSTPDSWVGTMCKNGCPGEKGSWNSIELHGFPSSNLPLFIIAVCFGQLSGLFLRDTYRISLENPQFSDFCGFHKGFAELHTQLVLQYLGIHFSWYNGAAFGTAKVISCSGALAVFHSVFTLLCRKWVEL